MSVNKEENNINKSGPSKYNRILVKLNCAKYETVQVQGAICKIYCTQMYNIMSIGIVLRLCTSFKHIFYHLGWDRPNILSATFTLARGNRASGKLNVLQDYLSQYWFGMNRKQKLIPNNLF